MEYSVNGEELNNSGNKWHLLSCEIKFTEYSVLRTVKGEVEEPITPSCGFCTIQITLGLPSIRFGRNPPMRESQGRLKLHV